jgi:hypothetical protein
MDERGASTWALILGVAGVLLAVAMVVLGQFLVGFAIIALIVVMAAGALLSTRAPTDTRR